MFIHVIRGATAGLAATALIGTTFAILAREWVAVLFGACALGIFIGIARLVWSTSNQPLVDPGKSQLGPFHTLSGKLLIGLLAAGAVVGGPLTVAVDADAEPAVTPRKSRLSASRKTNAGAEPRGSASLAMPLCRVVVMTGWRGSPMNRSSWRCPSESPIGSTQGFP
ncbi:hypothetical protein LCGC14_3136990 [marine sediment metagenome]|uniref:Uncharacterized protein n=1 Tax=marine sediment metagenome TaxID=412755 RepID=A0A0F8WLW4_9ZZZZ